MSSRSYPSRLTSWNPANPHHAVLVRTIEIGNSRLLHDDPVRAVFVLQPQEIFCAKSFPRSLRLHLLPPLFSQRRKHADYTVVLDCFGELASLRQAAEPDFVFAGEIHIFRIEGEDRIYGRVVPDPNKC